MLSEAVKTLLATRCEEMMKQEQEKLENNPNITVLGKMRVILTLQKVNACMNGLTHEEGIAVAEWILASAKSLKAAGDECKAMAQQPETTAP